MSAELLALCRDLPIADFEPGGVLLGEGLFTVPDLARDPRFRDSPLVTGTPPMRFYAGAPLQLPDGSRVGMLCLIDTRPRQLDDCDLAILGALRDLVVEELLAGVRAAA